MVDVLKLFGGDFPKKKVSSDDSRHLVKKALKTNLQNFHFKLNAIGVSVQSRVTRFGEISPLWQKQKSLGHLLKVNLGFG